LGERFGVYLPELQAKKINKPKNTTTKSKKSGEELLAEFYVKISDFDNEETIK